MEQPLKEWKSNIRTVNPYVPGEQPKIPGIIKLNTNENPYPPAPGVSRVQNSFPTEILKRYPDPTSGDLVKEIANYYHVDKEQVFVGVGSDDVLAMAFLTFFNSNKPILFPDITYSFYEVWAGLFKIPYDICSLDHDFHIVKEDYYRENGGIIFPNPNAPTGLSESKDVIKDILNHNQDVIVIVDEAYVDFDDTGSTLELLNKYENLLVVQTFSKSRSMAGMRIGFAIGSKEAIKALNNVKYSFNSYTMDALSIHMGVEAIKDTDYFNQTVENIVYTREWVKNELRKLSFSFPDSKTNFIFATHSTINAKDIFEKLKAKKIYVRYFNKPRIDNYLRISIGTMDEMKLFIEVLKNIINEFN